jgi:twitching motility protein PilI
MAKKEALRDLQSRLAERMVAVRTAKPQRTWLAVDCAGQGVLFPLQQAGEIFEAPEIVPVPHAKSWLAGVANLRGSLCAVVDLASFLGLRERRPTERADQHRLVGFNPKLGLNCALLVDRLEGLRHDADLECQAMAGEARPSFAPACWADRAGRVWQEIALTELAASEVFLGIAA